MKQQNILNRLLALLVCIGVLATLCPSQLQTAKAETTYGKIIQSGVKLRNGPSTSNDYYFTMALGTVVEVLEDKGSTEWYKVRAKHPDNDYTRDGYVLGTCLAYMTDEEVATYKAGGQVSTATATPTAVATATAASTTATATTAAPGPTPIPNAGSLGTIKEANVNLRDLETGDTLTQLAKGTVVHLIKLPQYLTEDYWFEVKYGDITGKVKGDMITIMTQDEATKWFADNNATPLASASTATPTAASGTATATAIATASANGGYLTIKAGLNSANLRSTPNGTRVATWNRSDANVLPYEGAPTSKGGYNWYYVKYNNKYYYVRDDVVTLCNASGGDLNATASPTVSSSTATATTAATVSATGYIKLTKGGVNLRQSENGPVISQLDKGVILPYTKAPTTKGNYTWYYVTTADGTKGYIRGDCCVITDASGNQTGTSDSTTTSSDTTVSGYLTLTKNGVNLRKTPAGATLEQLSKGTQLPIVGQSVTSGVYTWYYVKAASGRIGYVRSDCIQLVNAATATPDPNATATPTPDPNATATATSAVSGTYIQITKKNVNFRKTMGGSKIGTVNTGEVYQMNGSTGTKGGYTWYPITVKGTQGYVRGDCVQVLSDEQAQAYLNGQTIPTATPASGSSVGSGYVITILDDVNLRTSASKDATASYNVEEGTVMGYSTTQTVGGSLWYKVIYNNTELWVLGSCVKVMTSAEFQAWQKENPDEDQPATEVITGYVKLIQDGVNLRKTAGGSVMGRLSKGTILTYKGDPVYKGSHYWYYVKTSLGYGYVMDDMLQITDSSGSAVATAAPTGSSGSKEATYTTLKQGSSGDDVKAMVAELKVQGYYTGTIVSNYDSNVVAAVKAFQKAKGLTVDGVAGSATLHALYGTVPAGSSSSTQPSITIYPVEKIDWYTGGIQTIWAKGTNAVCMDVKTGITFTAYRWSGGSHADVEPLTAADTARICKIYNVSSADQITSSKHWERRPLYVTIGSRTFCASMYGVPHNYPAGDTISDNNFKGQFCIHFTNSKTHGSGKVDSGHAEAIQYAYSHAPNGTK